MMVANRMLTRSEEDYIKAIYNQTLDGSSASTLCLAASLSVASASVTNMLQKLAEGEPRLVEYHKHRGVSLTEAGRLAAMRIIRRHRLIETFLYHVMGYDWEQVHAEAEVLEHVISPFFEERLAEILEEPLLDPHGEPIPTRSGTFLLDEGTLRLSELPAGQTAEVRRVVSSDQALLVFIREAGLIPGEKVRILSRNPVDGTHLLSLVKDESHLAFSYRTAAAIWVKPV